MELDFTNEIMAGRPGPKSSAQTPSKPEERKKGSTKNKPGSAGTSPDSKEKAEKILKRQDDKTRVTAAITFSEKVTTSLKNKVKEHNEKHSRKVTLGMLKKVYRRGAGAFSGTHRPGQSRASWAMARVNMFLKMMRGGKVKDAYRKADSDIARASSDESIANLLDVPETWSPGDFDEGRDVSTVEFALARIDLLGSGCTHDELLEGEASFKEESQAIRHEDEVTENGGIVRHELLEESDLQKLDDIEIDPAREAEIKEHLLNQLTIKFIEAKEKKTLNKPFRLKGDKKKFGVYVKNDKGNVVMVKFGDPNMEIKRDDPERRKSFRARHQCDTNPGPKYKARYWSCRQWESGRKVEAELQSNASLLEIYPDLAKAEIVEDID